MTPPTPAPPPPDLMERVRQRITDAFEGELAEAEALEMFADSGWPVDEDALQPYEDALRELMEALREYNEDWPVTSSQSPDASRWLAAVESARDLLAASKDGPR